MRTPEQKRQADKAYRERKSAEDHTAWREYCNSHIRKWYKKEKENNPERLAEKDYEKFSKFYLSTKGRAAHMLSNARQRARRKNLKFELTRDWIKEKLDIGTCEVTGLPFVLEMNGGKGHRDNPFAPSIDRIDQIGDYTPKNCRVTVWIYNRARGAFPNDAFDLMIESLKGN